MIFILKCSKTYDCNYFNKNQGTYLERHHKGEWPRKVAVRVDVGKITIKEMGKGYKKSRSIYTKGFTNCLISHSKL